MNAVANTDGDGTPEPSGTTTIPKDELFHLLQNQRRRRVLLYLQDTDGRASMRDIAEQVAAWENDTTVRALDSDERQRVYIALYQSHLPKLDDAGVLEYNQQRGHVRRTPLADQLDAYLNVNTDSPVSSSDEETELEDSDESADREGITNDRSTTTDSRNTTNTNDSSNTNGTNDSSVIRYYGIATLLSVLSTTASWAGLISLSGPVLATVITGLFVTVTIGVLLQRDNEY